MSLSPTKDLSENTTEHVKRKPVLKVGSFEPHPFQSQAHYPKPDYNERSLHKNAPNVPYYPHRNHNYYKENASSHLILSKETNSILHLMTDRNEKTTNASKSLLYIRNCNKHLLQLLHHPPISKK